MQDAQEFVHPFGIVVGFHNQPLDAHQARGILPCARLTETVKAADVPPDQAALSKRLRLPVHRLHVAFGGGRVVADEVDVRFFLDQVFHHPCGVFVRLEHHGQIAAGG